MKIVNCADCGPRQTVTPPVPHEGSVLCVWCAHGKSAITGEQLADYERQGWAAGEGTLPHTFREDQANK